MSKSGYVLALVVLTAGASFAGCIVEYDGNEAAAGAATGGATATGGSTSKGGGTTGGSATTSGSSEGCSVAHRDAQPLGPTAFALSLGLALSFRRRRRARA